MEMLIVKVNVVFLACLNAELAKFPEIAGAEF